MQNVNQKTKKKKRNENILFSTIFISFNTNYNKASYRSLFILGGRCSDTQTSFNTFLGTYDTFYLCKRTPALLCYIYSSTLLYNWFNYWKSCHNSCFHSRPVAASIIQLFFPLFDDENTKRFIIYYVFHVMWQKIIILLIMEERNFFSCDVLINYNVNDFCRVFYLFIWSVQLYF